MLPLTWSRGSLFDQEVSVGTSTHAQSFFVFMKKAQSFSSVEVTQVKQSSGARTRPVPLNTVEMLKAASRSLGMGPKECMVYAEGLYLKGYISYPRTESTAYPEHYNLL